MNPEDMARIETLDELGVLLAVVQQLGTKLESQSHGYLHHHARELSELVQQARRRLELIKAESRSAGQGGEVPDVQPAQYRPRAF